jgi:hypothetical protein
LLLTRIEYFFFFFSFFFFFYLLSASVPNLKVQLEEAGRQPISRWIFPQAQVSVVRIFPDYIYIYIYTTQQPPVHHSLETLYNTVVNEPQLHPQLSKPSYFPLTLPRLDYLCKV